MSADDENKISENRRRLFKALSTAPVVMTLRPGQVLANASAFQCLDTPPPFPTTPVYLQPGLPSDCIETDGGCLAYVERFYWDKSMLSGAPESYWDEVVGSNSILVQTDPDNNPNLLYAVDKGSFQGSISNVLDPSVGFTLDTSTNVLSVPNNATSENPPAQVNGLTGYFLLGVKPAPDLMMIDQAFAYPQATQDPLARSCGTSLGVEATNSLHWVQG